MRQANVTTLGPGAVGGFRAHAARHSKLLWLTVLAAAFGAYFWRQHAEMQRVGGLVADADFRWMSLLLLVYFATLLTVAASYRTVLRRLGHDAPLHSCARIHLQRHVIGTITPVGGPASVYVLVRALGRRGVNTNDALLVTTIRSAVGYVAFMLVLVPALVLQRPTTLILGASVALMALMVIMLVALALMLRRQDNGPEPGGRLPGFAVRFLTDARSHGVRARDLLAPLALALAQNLGGALTVYICLRALGVESAFGLALIGYAIGNLFSIISPVFQGLGVVELTMGLALNQQGVPMTAAVAATLLYRFADVWFPLLLGSSVHAASIQSVRRVGVRIAPAVAVSFAAAVLVLGTRFASGLGIPIHEYAPPASIAVPFLVTLLAGIWMFGIASTVRRGQASLQAVPITALAVAIPITTLLIVGLEVSVAF